jgi:hypothetical protein
MVYRRKTADEFQVHGYYAGHWEEVTCEASRREALKRLREYRDNEPGTGFRMVRKRVRLESVSHG